MVSASILLARDDINVIANGVEWNEAIAPILEIAANASLGS